MLLSALEDVLSASGGEMEVKKTADYTGNTARLFPKNFRRHKLNTIQSVLRNAKEIKDASSLL